jgi:uncharacterized membrane protein
MDEARPPNRLAEYGLTGFFALAMIGGAIGHVVAPEVYAPLIPEPIPPTLANVAAAVAEGAIGVLLIVPRTRALGAAGFCALMVAFLPLHVWDALKDEPFVGSTGAAIARLVVQALFIAASAWLARSVHSRRPSARDGGDT